MPLLNGLLLLEHLSAFGAADLGGFAVFSTGGGLLGDLYNFFTVSVNRGLELLLADSTGGSL